MRRTANNICPICDAGDPTSVITSCDCLASKHTPGPMIQCPGTYEHGAQVKVVPKDSNDSTYVLIGGKNRDSLARLIAAAPETVKSLKQLEDFTSTFAEEGRIQWKNDAPVFWAIIEEARALLARIEGK